MKTIGLDGCRGGWVKACSIHGELISLEIISSLKEINVSNWDEIWIDIPVGLPNAENYPREVEKEARKMLKERRSSVFPVPCREILYESDYHTANQKHRELTGKGLSKQTWFLIDKMREADEWVEQKDKNNVYEAHPEVVFTGMNGVPMHHNKKTEEGFQERFHFLAELQSNKNQLAQHLEAALQRYLRKTAVRDDFLDAAALSIAGSHPGFKRRSLISKTRKDSLGRTMNMRYSEKVSP